MTRRSQRGFTLIELMVVVVIIGLLAAVAIPNYASMQRNAQEGGVKSNMHTLQLVMEDYSVQNDGYYPTSAVSALPDGRTLEDLCPTGSFPVNPFTSSPSSVNFNSDPPAGSPGQLAVNPALATMYIIKGNGAEGDTLEINLSTGQ
jgi:prepilin-type N-terminal cleavage/methylation domain-containing protein